MSEDSGIGLGKIAGIVGAGAVIIGAIFTIDERYVHADEFKKQVFQIKGAIDELHRARLEDEIFKLELIPSQKRTQADKALIERYKSQIKEIDSKRERESK